MFSSVQTYLSLYISVEEEQAAGTVPGAVVSMGWVRVARMKSKSTPTKHLCPCKTVQPPALTWGTRENSSEVQQRGTSCCKSWGIWIQCGCFDPTAAALSVFVGADFCLDCLNFCQTPQCWFAGLVCVFCVSILGSAGRDTWCFYP